MLVHSIRRPTARRSDSTARSKPRCWVRAGFLTLDELQREFDRWREVYNHERPHEAVGLEVPASRYAASKRSHPEQLPAITYDACDVVRKVMNDGAIRFHSDRYYISKAFEGEHVALRPSKEDGVWHVFFCHDHVVTVPRRHPVRASEHDPS